MVVASPSVGVIKVGLVVNATVLVPLSSVRAAARFADEGVAKKVATPVPRPVIDPIAGVIVDVVTPVIRPLALTVIRGTAVTDPYEPTLELTVANVALVIAVPVLPDRVRSPPVTEIEPDMFAVETAVTNPLALTVTTGIKVCEPKVPIFPLTVANVPVPVTLPVPSNDPEV